MWNHLFLIEKMFLKYQAFVDVKCKLISCGSVNTAVTGNGTGDDRGQTTFFVKQCISSPFIIEELRRYNAKRDYLMASRPTFYWRPISEHTNLPWISSFPDMIGITNETINEYASDINMLNISYSDEISSWENKMQDYQKAKQPHMVQLCINKAYEQKSCFYTQTQHKYNKIVYLLTQQLHKYDKADKVMRKIRSRHFSRITYYYKSALRLAAKDNLSLPIDGVDDESLSKIGNTDTLENYADIINNLKDRLAKYKREQDYLSGGGQDNGK
jgi:hypothetical protein